MTAFTYTWNATFLAQPADTDDEAQGAQRIRDTKAAVGERLAVDHSLAGDANDGKHDWATLRNAGQTTPFTLDATDGRVFAAAAGGNTELFYQDSSGNVIQITKTGIPVSSQFTSGTALLFANTVVPLGWSVFNTYNDMMIRLVNNSASGGTIGGSWTISGATVAGHALTIAEMPTHSHEEFMPVGATGTNPTFQAGTNNANGGSFDILITTGAQGNNAAHSHGLTFDGTWRPSYYDVWIGVKS